MLIFGAWIIATINVAVDSFQTIAAGLTRKASARSEYCVVENSDYKQTIGRERDDTARENFLCDDKSFDEIDRRRRGQSYRRVCTYPGRLKTFITPES